MKIIQVTLPDEVHSALKDSARVSRISMAEVVRQILSQWVSKKARKAGAS